MKLLIVLFLGLCLCLTLLTGCGETYTTNGANGVNSLIVTTQVEDCIIIETGQDYNFNGLLDYDEITSENEVCNGENGIDGENGEDGKSQIIIIKCKHKKKCRR